MFQLKALQGGGEATGLELIEIAPGIDLQRDVLAQMDFVPAISPGLAMMDAALFQGESMGLRERMLTTPLAQRFELDRAGGRLFINFEGLAIHDAGAIETIRRQVDALLAPLGQRVAVVVNYDNFQILPTLVEAYSSMVEQLTASYYSSVTRYGTGGFLKARLEAAGS